MSNRVTPLIASALLVIVSTVFTYVALQFAIFRIALPVMPLNIRPHLPDKAEVLVQNSKAAYLPRDYVALLGDSNAQGLGDWLIEAHGDRTRPFHSADVIHELTGRDVVTFGKGGAGSAESIVLRLSRIFPSSGCWAFPVIDPPAQMFVYFYEGNDMEDNFIFYHKVIGRYGRFDATTINRYLDESYAVSRPWQCPLHLAEMTAKMIKFLYRYYVGGASIRDCGAATPQANHIIVGSRSVDAPQLQGPALMFSDENLQSTMEVLARSLAWLHRRFDGVPVSIVYIPSPISIYHHEGDTAVVCGVGSTPVLEAERRHDLMRRLVEKIVADSGMNFIDATPVLRAAASTTTIHGPRDWDHLNEPGYHALGTLIASHIGKETFEPGR